MSEPESNPHDPSYQRQLKLGRGGMGEVYRERQGSLGRDVAVKYLHPNRAEDEGLNKLLKREAEVLAQLDHPNIVPIYDYGQNQEGAWFYSMKEIRGTPWNKELKEKRTTQPREVFLKENIETLLRVADAIAFAHTKGIYHLDLKPDNIMLGEFGEVLVTDWGIAKTEGSIEEDSERGTPQYASPEAAEGSFEKMGACSDIYLLGAILFEIITGKPPHELHRIGAFINAARNEIVETEHKGELIDIALQAMNTEPAERYASVRDMQQALREYEEHTESNRLADLAQASLEQADSAEGYGGFQAAVFGFENAHELWPGNQRAEQGALNARLAYATRALERNDFDLGLSLPDPSIESHAEMIEKLRDGKRERDAKEHRLRWTRRAFRISTVAAIIILIVGLSVSSYYWRESVKQTGIAKTNETKAVKNAVEADIQRGFAVDNAEESDKNAFVAELNAALQTTATKLSERQAEIAEQRRQEADAARKLARQAERKTREEAYLSLIGGAAARIEDNSVKEATNLLERAQKLEDAESTEASAIVQTEELQPWLTQALNETRAEWLAQAESRGIDAKQEVEQRIIEARQQLEVQLRNKDAENPGEPDDKLRLRNWEWGHLSHLAHQSFRDVEARTPLDVVAFAPDGKHFITGGEDGKVRWWRLRDALDAPDDAAAMAPVDEGLAVNGFVFAASFFHSSAPVNDGESAGEDFTYLAIGSNDSAGYVRLWKWNPEQSDFPSGAPTIVLRGHEDAVTSVDFSHDGKLLLTSSFDGTSRVWQVADGKPLHMQRGHEGPVWDAVFAPGTDSQLRFATAGDDGAAIVWELDQPSNESSSDDPKWKPLWEAYGNHYGAVHAVRFLADGSRFVTAGQDGRIVVWNPPPAASPTDEDAPTAAVAQRTLSGHTGAVRSLKLLSDSTLLSCGDDNTIRLWNIETAQSMRVLRGHSSLVRACDSSTSEDPAMHWVLSGSHDEKAKLWQIAAHREAHVFGAYMFQDHAEGVLAAAFANDGQRFVTAGLDRQGNVQTLSESPEGLLGDKQVKLAEGHQFAIRDVKFHADGRLLTSSIDRSVRMWSQQGHELATLPGTGRAGAMAVSENWIATGSDGMRDGSQNVFTAASISSRLDNYEQVTRLTIGDSWGIKLWPADTSEDRANPERFLRTFGEVTALTFSSDGRHLFSGHANGRCMLWELGEGESPRLLWGAEARHKPTTEAIMGAVFVSDEHVLAASTFGQMIVWTISTGEALRTLPPPQVGEGGSAPISLRDVAMASNAARKLLAVAFAKGPVWVSDLTGQEGWVSLDLPLPESSASERRIANVDFSPNGKWLVASEPSEKKAYLWDTEIFSAPRVLEITDTAAQSLNRLDAAYFDPTLGDELGVLTVSGTSARRWQYVGQLESVPPNAPWKEITRIGPHSAITSAQFSPGAKWIATAGLDECVKIWDAKGNVVAKLQHDERINHVAFVTSSDRLQVLTASHDGFARLWDVGPQDESSIRTEPSEVGKFGPEHPTESDHVRIALAFTTAGGRRILTAGDDGKAVIWDESGKPVGPPVAEHASSIMAAAVSADGSLIITGSNDTTARLWNSDTGQPVNNDKNEPIILRHTGPVISVALSPDGQRIITGSEDTTAKIWDRKTGRELITLRGHARPVTSVAFQPNPQPNGKRYVLTCSRDGATILWPAEDWGDKP